MSFSSNPVEKPIYRETQPQPQKQTIAYAGDPLFKKASYRNCPNCKSPNCKRNGRDTKGRIRRKCQCGKSFIIDWRVWNFEKLFSDVFEDGFINLDRQVSIQYKQRIWNMILRDKKIQEFISNAIIEVTADKSYSDDDKDEHTFIQACILADNKDSDEASKVKDSWHFLLNNNNTDVSYILGEYAYTLIRKYNFNLSKRQPINHGLLRCNKCGLRDISTHGFNNNARRRIKCHNCQRISVITVSHLISQDDLSYYCREYLKDYTRDETLINTIVQTLQHNFISFSKSKKIDKLMARQAVITHDLKKQMIKAFIGTEIIRLKRTFQQEIWTSLFNLLNLESNINSQGYLNVKKGLFYALYPKTIADLLSIDKVDSVDAYDFNSAEIEMAAHLHDEHIFYDWETRSQQSYQNMMKDLLIENK